MSGVIQEPLVSVVMPVYNAEEYLDEALDTVSGQTYHALEIICVNDGSTDGSAEILERKRDKDPRIRVILQDHQGAGAARNLGMKAAKGKYIIFLDSDDVFRKEMIRLLVRTAEKNDTDILIHRYYKFSEGKRINARFSARDLKVPIGKVISPSQISDRLYQADHGMPWNKFYRADFVRESGVEFQSLMNTNDEYFSRITTAEAKRIMFLDSTYVGYRVGNSKSIQGRVDRSILDFTKALAAIHDELKNRGLYDTFHDTYQKLVSIMIMWRLEERKDSEDFRILAEEICTETMNHCEAEEIFAEERYKEVFRALQRKDISGALTELKQTEKNEVPLSAGQRIKRFFEKRS